MKKILVLSFLALMFALTASHAEVTIEGVWSSKKGCSPNTDGVFDDASSFLTNDKVYGHEWLCEFVQKYYTEDGRIIAISACAAEGDEWPDTLMILPRDGGWDVVSSKDNTYLNFPMQCRKEAN
jgi:hypothetical protein